MTPADRAKMLKRGLPSAFTVADPVARQVLEALREAIMLLAAQAVGQIEQKRAVTAAGVSGLEEGEGIEIEPLGNGIFRVSCTVQEGGGGGVAASGGGAESLDDLDDVDAPSPTVGQALVFDGEKWVAGDVAAAGTPSAPKIIGGASSLPGTFPLAEGADDDPLTTSYSPTEADQDGLSLWVCVRERYSHAGSMKWFTFYRKLTWPKALAPVVSTESRATTDEPVP